MSEEKEPYFVVFETLSGPTAGIKTFSLFKDGPAFDEWYGGRMQDGTNQPLREVYNVVAKGVTLSEAQKVVSSPENQRAHDLAALRATVLQQEMFALGAK